MKSEIIKRNYKKMILAGKIEANQGVEEGNKKEENYREKEHPITIEIAEVFVGISKNDVVIYFSFAWVLTLNKHLKILF